MLRKKKKVIPQFEHEQIQAENVREYHEGVFFFFFHKLNPEIVYL